MASSLSIRPREAWAFATYRSPMSNNVPLRIAAAFVFSMALTGCPGETAKPSIVGVNYSSHSISTFLVNGRDGANVPAHGGGGGFVCCIDVPRRWHKGLTARVQWTEYERDPAKWREAVVPIPIYKSNETSFFMFIFTLTRL